MEEEEAEGGTESMHRRGGVPAATSSHGPLHSVCGNALDTIPSDRVSASCSGSSNSSSVSPGTSRRGDRRRDLRMMVACYVQDDADRLSSSSSSAAAAQCNQMTSSRRSFARRTRRTNTVMSSLSLVIAMMGICFTLVAVLPTACQCQEIVDDAKEMGMVDPDLEVADGDALPILPATSILPSPSSSSELISLDSNMVEVDGEIMDVDALEEDAVVETDGGGEGEGDGGVEDADIGADGSDTVEDPTATPEAEQAPAPPAEPTTGSVSASPTQTGIADEPTPKPALGDGNETAVPTELPTATPSTPKTPVPTTSPTFQPTISKIPTSFPTVPPTEVPTEQPTLSPTGEPTFETESMITGFYQQDIVVTEEKLFTDLQILIFEDLYQSYTPFYGPGKGIVDPNNPEATIKTTCEVTGQSLLGGVPAVDRFGTRLLRRRRRRRRDVNVHESLSHSGGVYDLLHERILQDGETEDTEEVPPLQLEWNLRVVFQMTWTSRYIVVTDYADEFPNFINSNLTMVTEDMVASGLRTVKQANPVFREQKTPPPTMVPTTASPTAVPSAPPTDFPTLTPTSRPIMPTPRPTTGDKGGLSPGAIGAIAAGGGAAALIIGYFLYQSRKQRIEKARQLNMRSKKHGKHGSRGGSGGMAAVAGPGGSAGGHRRNGTNSGSGDWASRINGTAVPADQMDQNGDIVIGGPEDHAIADSPGGPFPYIADPTRQEHAGVLDDDHIPTNDSLVSNGSLISVGHSMSSGSGNEMDHRGIIADEFDQYKDQNLEKMRNEVEGVVTNAEGMMSQALTKALMDDDDDPRDIDELRWGGNGQSMEIEASVLCDTNDWLKRKESPSVDERRAFMQETLNRMVASVRHGVISPEDASRTIHECAAMLRLELAEKIPETALIITGMRKMVEGDDVIDAFKEFGEIEDAAVSPNARGFGLVRFVSPKSVLRALDKFRKEEIVVQDVAVMIRVLKSDDMLMPMRDTPSSQNQPVPPGSAPRATPAGSRTSAMEAHHGADLDTIGYPGSSIGGATPTAPRYPVHSRGPGSDTRSDTRSDTSGRSRSSNKSSGHRRNESAVKSVNSDGR
mmetsp:Transcript_30148/g.66295  ORF Transcript_30148/g.66295 Transcript_30148/m.66295 type:complete len:1079 (+) Transcript_30148:95-3331(+)